LRDREEAQGAYFFTLTALLSYATFQLPAPYPVYS
jgi:hypothetical protein